jgi:fatty-acyl-CoA synthase
VRHGDRVAWLGPNDPFQLLQLFACAENGAIHLPLNWRLAAPELRFILEDAEARLLCVADGDDDMLALAKACAPASCRVIACAEMLRHVDFIGAKGGADDSVLLVYTSGTTGRPKGALLSQHAVQANADNARAAFDLTHRDCVLTFLPMFHVGGLNIQTVPALLNGAEVILWRHFDADDFFVCCAESRPDLSLLVPTLMRRLVEHPRWKDADLSSLRAVGAGSSDVPLDLIEAFQAKGVPVQQVYGTSETGPIAIVQSRAEALVAPGSIGRPALLCRARVQDSGGGELPQGEEGEIAINGPNVMSGYWKRDDGLDADGWFATGDVGRIDPEGRFWFTDRLKHVIISGGENIYPAEVERVLATAPGVAEGAVVGRPDPKWGEVPVAVVVPADGFDAARVLAHFEGRIARFKHPRAVVTLPALPRTALGKIAVAELRAEVSRAG